MDASRRRARHEEESVDGAGNTSVRRTKNGLSAAQPTVFGSHVGLFSAPDEGLPRRDLAVLFLSPWGMEEMCTRKLYRILSEHFAALGVASLLRGALAQQVAQLSSLVRAVPAASASWRCA